jgi:hypothetical protein
VNHVGAVNHHIAGFVIGDEPARVEAFGKLLQTFENAAESQPFAARFAGLLFENEA